MRFRIKLAERIVEVVCKYDRVWHSCVQYLTEEGPPDIVVHITENDYRFENELYLHNDPFLDRKLRRMSDIDFESTAVYRKICDEMLRYSTILMHGSVLSDGKNGYMFAAKSGVGKTTRTKLFLEVVPNSVVVNGDKPLLIVKKDGIYACGTPWSGKEQLNTNTIVPLKAIFFLKRGEYTKLDEISFDKALPHFMQQVYFPEKDENRKKVLKLVHEISNKVKLYSFQSEPTQESVLKAYKLARI